MLTLSRRPGEIIRIGDDILVIVQSIKGKQVKLGVIAPPGITVHREEIYKQIQEQKNGQTTRSTDS